jgi:hypothetical protein
MNIASIVSGVVMYISNPFCLSSSVSFSNSSLEGISTTFAKRF